MPCSLEDKISSLELIPLSDTTITSLDICFANSIAKFLSTSKVLRSLLLIPTNFGSMDKAVFSPSIELNQEQQLSKVYSLLLKPLSHIFDKDQS